MAMNVLRIRNICSCNYLFKFRSAHKLANAENEIELLPKQDVKVAQSTSGITVASVENYSPISCVSVVVKAGSRYENAQSLGISHCLRNCAVLSTKNHTAFSITRSLELQGAKVGVVGTREHLIYTLKCARDDIDSGLEILADIATQPAFKSWEVNDVSPRMHVDLAILESNAEAVLMENLHKAAFRGGLSNSLHSPPFMVGKHTSEMLHSFFVDNFTASRTSVVGLGVAHDHLTDSVGQLFDLNRSSSSNEIVSKFSGGEIRVEADIPFVHAAIVAEGSGLVNTKEMLSLGVLQCLLGTGANSKHGLSKSSRLGEAAAKCTSHPFCVTSLNINYSDSGLFGVYVGGHPDDMKQLVKSIVSQMRDVTKNITEDLVQIAKHKLKTKLFVERESSNDLLSVMAAEASLFGQIKEIKDLERSIDELSSSDIASVAAKVMKTKPAMASIGRLHSTPHLGELI